MVALKRKTSISPLTKTMSYVAFLDILGFTALLDDKLFDKKIAQLANKLQSRATFDNEYYPDINYIAVSDSIIITAPEGSGYPLVRKTAQIQIALLKIGFATRGAISFGPVLMHEGRMGSNIFGKTYLDAYHGERDLAFYPRVVVQNNTVDALNADIASSTSRPITTYLLNDTDGVTFINQFLSDRIGLQSKLGRNQKNARENCDVYLAVINRNLNHSNPRAKMKWQWLKHQFDDQLLSLIL